MGQMDKARVVNFLQGWLKNRKQYSIAVNGFHNIQQTFERISRVREFPPRICGCVMKINIGAIQSEMRAVLLFFSNFLQEDIF